MTTTTTTMMMMMMMMTMAVAEDNVKLTDTVAVRITHSSY